MGAGVQKNTPVDLQKYADTVQPSTL